MIDPSLKSIVKRKRFGMTNAVNGIDLGVEGGDWLSLLGPSVCGKTRTLRMIAGFIKPDAAVVKFKGRDVTAAPPCWRKTGMIFQNQALFPL